MASYNQAWGSWLHICPTPEITVANQLLANNHLVTPQSIRTLRDHAPPSLRRPHRRRQHQAHTPPHPQGQIVFRAPESHLARASQSYVNSDITKIDAAFERQVAPEYRAPASK
ncbi:hypothetical protein GCM10010470_27780 [Saccharopolyspora taberi]|uniref:Uncharacterized protein n=1 Tax=Saccharopolyspora taberi TaxID=60895 RepID=A0ABN3VE59_9PSEU